MRPSSIASAPTSLHGLAICVLTAKGERGCCGGIRMPFRQFSSSPPLIIPALPIYLPLIAIYAGWLALRSGRPNLMPQLFLLFVATHVSYGFGQIEGLFVHGDNEQAAARPDRVALISLKNAGNKGDEAISNCVARRLSEAGSRGKASVDSISPRLVRAASTCARCQQALRRWT